MSCRCKSNNIRSTAVVIVGAFLVVIIPPVAFDNKECFNLIICQPIPAPAAGTNPQVIIFDGTTIYPVLNKIGNFVRANQIGCRRAYPSVFGNDPVHISILCGLQEIRQCCDGDGFIQAVPPVALTEDLIISTLNSTVPSPSDLNGEVPVI